MPARKTARKVKKTTPRRTSSVENVQSYPVLEGEPSGSSLKIKKSYLFTLLLIAAVVGLLYFFKGIFVAAVVNGQPITRVALIQELERQSGKQTLDALVTKTLIYQETAKKGISVSDADINAEIKKDEDELKKQGRQLSQELAAQGMTLDSLKDQIRLRKTVEKMFANDMKVSDKEIADYFEKNKSQYPQGSTVDKVKDNIKSLLAQQKMYSKFQEWIANVKKNSKTLYFVSF